MREAIRRGRRGGDEGLTLVELLVSMIIFSIAIAMVYSAVILTLRWSREAQQSADAVTELRNALAQIDRQVRSGNVLFSPAAEPSTLGCVPMGAQAGTCMRIFTQSNGPEKCVQWRLKTTTFAPDGTTQLYDLQTRSWETNWTTGGVVSGWSAVAHDLTVDTVAPFTLLGASTVYKERSLQLHLQVYDDRKDDPVAVDSTLTGRNTSYGYTSGQCTPIPPG